MHLTGSACKTRGTLLQQGDFHGCFPWVRCHPICTWSCQSQPCEETCEPLCAGPVCETRCPGIDIRTCTEECDEPDCTVRGRSTELGGVPGILEETVCPTRVVSVS